MDLRQFLIIMRARLRVIITVLLVTVGVASLVSFLLPKNYTATASVVVDVKADPVNGLLLPVQMMPGYLATQVDIIISQKVALEAVKYLRLAENPVAKQQFEEVTGGQGSIDHWLADLLLKKLNVAPARESSVINIEYKATEPQFAAAVANAFAQGYIATNLELRVEPARQTAIWFGGQSKILRENLENAQAKLSKYQRDHGIVSPEERLDVESARLADLSSQLVGVQGMTYESQNRERKAKELITSGASTDELAEVINQPVIVGLKSDVARSEAKVHEMESQYGKNHPQLQQAHAQLAELKRKLATEIANVTKGLANTNAINERREAGIKGALEAQRRRVLAAKQQRDEMAVLMREVDAAQKGFDAVTSRLTQTNLESQTNQTNIAVLSPAVEPREASSPKILLNIALSVLVGLLLGMGVAVALELADRRIRSADDLKALFDAPVLGVLAKDVGLKKRFRNSRLFARRAKRVSGAIVQRIEPVG